MDKEGFEPAFPFGHGMSYTKFSYSNLRLDKDQVKQAEEIKVMVDISNNGQVGGEEIVQLYISYNSSSVDRPVKELKGFAKLFLNSKETKTITLTLKTEELAYYDIEKKKWIIENGEYTILVGPSSKKEDLMDTKFIISS